MKKREKKQQPELTEAQKARKKRSSRIMNGILIVILLAGVGLMAYPTLSSMYVKWQAQQEINKFVAQVESIEGEDYTAFWEAAEAYNAALAAAGNQFSLEEEEKEEIYAYLDELDENMLGYISIPAIDVNLPLYRGTSEKQLQSGVGWWIGTSLPTGGESTHCVITGHTGLVKGKMFDDVDQLEIGDTFTLKVLDRTLTYEVDQILIVDPDDFEDLEIVPGEDYVTLYTCYPVGVNTHRLLVRGHRIETPEDETTSTSIVSAVSKMPMWMIIAILLLIVLLVLLLWRALRRKKRLEKERQAAAAATAAAMLAEAEAEEVMSAAAGVAMGDVAAGAEEAAGAAGAAADAVGETAADAAGAAAYAVGETAADAAGDIAGEEEASLSPSDGGR